MLKDRYKRVIKMFFFQSFRGLKSSVSVFDNNSYDLYYLFCISPTTDNDMRLYVCITPWLVP